MGLGTLGFNMGGNDKDIFSYAHIIPVAKMVSLPVVYSTIASILCPLIRAIDFL